MNVEEANFGRRCHFSASQHHLGVCSGWFLFHHMLASWPVTVHEFERTVRNYLAAVYLCLEGFGYEDEIVIVGLANSSRMNMYQDTQFCSSRCSSPKKFHSVLICRWAKVPLRQDLPWNLSSKLSNYTLCSVSSGVLFCDSISRSQSGGSS